MYHESVGVGKTSCLPQEGRNEGPHTNNVCNLPLHGKALRGPSAQVAAPSSFCAQRLSSWRQWTPSLKTCLSQGTPPWHTFRNIFSASAGRKQDTPTSFHSSHFQEIQNTFPATHVTPNKSHDRQKRRSKSPQKTSKNSGFTACFSTVLTQDCHADSSENVPVQHPEENSGAIGAFLELNAEMTTYYCPAHYAQQNLWDYYIQEDHLETKAAMKTWNK